MSLNLNQAVLGLQALSAGLTTELFQLRQELEIQQREQLKDANKVMGETAVAQANASYNATQNEADSMKQNAEGDLIGNIAQGGAMGAGEFKAKALNDAASEAHTRVDTLKTQIGEKEIQLGIRPAIVVDGAAAPAAAGVVGDPVQVRKELDDLRSQLRDAQGDAQHHENMVAQTRTSFQAMGSSLVGGIKGSTGIAAAQSMADKAQYDAAAVIFSYMLQIVKSVADALAGMAQAQESGIKDVAAMLQSQTGANHVSA